MAGLISNVNVIQESGFAKETEAHLLHWKVRGKKTNQSVRQQAGSARIAVGAAGPAHPIRRMDTSVES